MKLSTKFVYFFILLIFFSLTSVAQLALDSASPDWKEAYEKSKTAAISLKEFTERTAKALKVKILVDSQYVKEIIHADEHNTPKNYAEFLSQLKANGFSAYRSEEHIHVVNFRDGRNLPIPTVEEGKIYEDDELVTDIIQLKRICANGALATLRPLVPQSGHMTTYTAARSLIISDTFANIQRLRKVINMMDQRLSKAEECIDPPIGKYSSGYGKVTLGALAMLSEKYLKTPVLLSEKDSQTLISAPKDFQPKDYGELLTALTRNEFTAFRSNNEIHIIQVRQARDSAVPIVEKGKTYYPDEYVTDFIPLNKACIGKTFSTLRRLSPEGGHFTTHEQSRMLIMTNTYVNVMKMKAFATAYDESLKEVEDCTTAKAPEIRLVRVE